MKKYGANYSRLKDYDQIVFEVFQVFLVKLILNMLVKFSSRDEKKRRDSYMSAKLLLAIANQFLDKKKPHYKQIKLSLSEVTKLYIDQGAKENKFVSDQEIQDFRDLIEKPLEGKITIDTETMPEEIKENFSKIE